MAVTRGKQFVLLAPFVIILFLSSSAHAELPVCEQDALYTLRLPRSMAGQNKVQIVNESHGVTVVLYPEELTTICGNTLGDAEMWLDPPDVIQELISMTIGVNIGVGRLDQQHLVDTCGPLSGLVGGSTSDFVFVAINDMDDFGKMLLTGPDADRKKQSRAAKGGQKKKSLGSRFRANALTSLEKIVDTLPLCMAIRPCAADFSITGDDIGREITFGFYSGGGIVLASNENVELTFHGLAFASAGDLVPFPFNPPLWGDKTPEGMHLWLDGALGFPIKRRGAGGVSEMIGALAIRAQFGVYGAINGSPKIGEFLNSLSGCDGADVSGLNNEFELESVLVQLFANARIEVTLDLEKLLNLPPGTEMTIGADAGAFMFEFARRGGEDTFEPVMFDVWSCSNLGTLLRENVWVAAQLSKLVYQKEGGTETDHSYLVTDGSCESTPLSIFRLDKISPIAGFNAEIHYVREVDTIVVVFRGTDKPDDWLTNLDDNTRQCSLAYPCGDIHSGFQSETHRTASHVLTALQRIVASSSNSAAVKIGITGHSLGGALAQGFAMWLCGNEGGDSALCASIDWVTTFGAPMICGDHDCEAKYESLLGSRTKRFVNACGPEAKHDPVVPNPPGYAGPGLPIQLPSPGVTPTLSPGGNSLCHSKSVYVDAVKANSFDPSNRCHVSPASPPFIIGDVITAAMETNSPRISAVSDFSAGSCSVIAVPDAHGPLAFLENTFNRVMNPGFDAHVDIRASLGITTNDLAPILEEKLGKFGKFMRDVIHSTEASLTSKMMLRLALPGPQVEFGFKFDGVGNLNLECREIQFIIDTITGVVNFIKGFFQTLQGFISVIQDVLELIERDPNDPRHEDLGPLRLIITNMSNVLGDCDSIPKTGLCGLIETISGTMDDSLAGVLRFTNTVCGDGIGMGFGAGFAFLDGSVSPQDTYVAAWRGDEHYKLSLDMLPGCGAGDASRAVGEKCLSNDDCVTGNCNLLDLSLHNSGDALCFGTCNGKLGQWELCTDTPQCQDGLGCCGGICVKQEDDGQTCHVDCDCNSGACTRGTCGTLGPGEPCWPAFDHHCTGHENGNTCCGWGVASACGGRPDGFTTCFANCACESGLCIQGECCSASQCGHDDACQEGEYCEIVLGQGCGTCKSKKEGGAECTDLTPVVGQSTDQCLSGLCNFGFCLPKNNGQACNDDDICKSDHCCGVVGESGLCQQCCEDPHCPSSQHCLLYECKNDVANGVECFRDSVCQSDRCGWSGVGVCQECRDHVDCGAGKWCDAMGECQPEWDDGHPCLDTVECHNKDPGCEWFLCGGSCDSDAACQSDSYTRYCQLGACVECKQDSHCGVRAEKHCLAFSCVDGCNNNEDCPLNKHCSLGSCTWDLGYGGACGTDDEVCKSGHCQFPRCVECKDDNHCSEPAAPYCTGGPWARCKQCTQDSHCGDRAGKICNLDYNCVTGCNGHEDCPISHHCSLDESLVGSCTDDLEIGEGCASDSACKDGFCGELGVGTCQACREHPDCGDGMSCDLLGRCQQCLDNGDCTDPDMPVCISNECKPKQPDGYSVCNPLEDQCVNECCGGTCRQCCDNDDCADPDKPVCISNECKPKQPDGYSVCNPLEDECVNFCILGTCRQCRNDGDCSSGYCSGNACYSYVPPGGSSDSGRCQYGSTCGICQNSNEDVESGRSCSTNDECSSNQCCKTVTSALDCGFKSCNVCTSLPCTKGCYWDQCCVDPPMACGCNKWGCGFLGAECCETKYCQECWSCERGCYPSTCPSCTYQSHFSCGTASCEVCGLHVGCGGACK